MENTIITSKYLHKKFKKSVPTIITASVTTPASNSEQQQLKSPTPINNEKEIINPLELHNNLTSITTITQQQQQSLVNNNNSGVNSNNVPNNRTIITINNFQADLNRNSVLTSTNSVLNKTSDQVASISKQFLENNVPFSSSNTILSSQSSHSPIINDSKSIVTQPTKNQNHISNEIDKNKNSIIVKWELTSSSPGASYPQTSSSSITSESSQVTTNSTPTVTISIPTLVTDTELIYHPTPTNNSAPTSTISSSSASTSTSTGKYVCSYCNLSCSKPSVLQKHIRAHTNERPYPCVSCGFSFKTRSNLYKHCRSRSHANRTKDTPEVVSSNAPASNTTMPPNVVKTELSVEVQSEPSNVMKVNNNNDTPKSKPYKPKFRHSLYSESSSNDLTEIKEQPNQKLNNDLKQNTDLLKQHINNLIHKNQTILDVNEPNILKKRFLYQLETDENKHNSRYESNTDEPLNLTARNRKRCMSETEHSQKSLIKELLLKNLTQEQSYVCQFCKISFKNIENFEIHRKKYCKVGENPTSKDIALVRSHSVNVASVLTNKYSRNNESPSKFVRTTLPLKSPGPYLGKTSLIGDKPNQVFYENKNPTRIHHAALSISAENLRKIYDKNDIYNNSNNLFKNQSPVIVDPNNEKKRNYEEFQMYSPTVRKHTPVKMFGGEVKITETSGETRSYKIDSKHTNDFTPTSQNFDVDFVNSNKVSENMVVKSSLQSGGTILQNNSNYDAKSPFTPKLEVKSPIFHIHFPSDKIIHENSPRKVSFDHQNDTVKKEQSRFTFDELSTQHQQSDIIYDQRNFTAKMFAPNIKQPNLTIPGLPVPNKIFTSPKKYNDNLMDQQISPNWVNISTAKYSPNLKYRSEMITPHTVPKVTTPISVVTTPTIVIDQKQVKFRNDIYPNTTLPSVNKLPEPARSPNFATMNPGLRLYDPLNIVVNGKLMRYVPGMPGPETPSNALQIGYLDPPPIIATQLSPKIIKTSPVPNNEDILKISNYTPRTSTYLSVPAASPHSPHLLKIPQSTEKRASPKVIEPNFTITSTVESSVTLNSIISTSTAAQENIKQENPPVEKTSKNNFLRPNSLALKPYIKTHHGLTPTVFNQALISPDTPRVAKKYVQLYLNGNCFSYLGLKSSTKSTYCTLNKTQPFYVQSFGTLSMYSEWRHLECKLDYMRLDTYDSRQRRKTYSIAKTKIADLIVDSSYKSVMIEASQKKEENTTRCAILPGGYESNEEYTYIRGRGRGKYVCDQCGIRCKKPSMLKKHIRTHSDVRPYTCQQCNFSFKTKGNLTKHMKSKAHYKRTNHIPSSEANGGDAQTSQCSSTPSDDDSDSDADNENDSDDSTRLQDHEAAHCLLSLAQNRSPATTTESESSEITIRESNHHSDKLITKETTYSIEQKSQKNLLENMSSRKPLTYPYYKVQVKPTTPVGNIKINTKTEILKSDICTDFNHVILGAKNVEFFNQSFDKTPTGRSNELFSPGKVLTPTKIQYIGDKLPNADVTIANYQQKFVKYEQERAAAVAAAAVALNQPKSELPTDLLLPTIPTDFNNRKRLSDKSLQPDFIEKRKVVEIEPASQDTTLRKRHISADLSSSVNLIPRKRKISYPETRDKHISQFHTYENTIISNKPYNAEPSGIDLSVNRDYVENRFASARNENSIALDLSKVSVDFTPTPPKILDRKSPLVNHYDSELNCDLKLNLKKKMLNYKIDKSDDFIVKESSNDLKHFSDSYSENSNSDTLVELSSADKSGVSSENISDTSAMQTLAEIAMKRVSTENTKLAQSVATEYLKLATKNEQSPAAGVIIEPSTLNVCNGTNSTPVDNSINDLIVKSEENKSCTICSKNFSKPSQLRLHMNIHYIERPFRCESCSISFRSKGHLQKHERSASHHNKLSSSPTTSSSEPRPFKCSDCNIAFRIHGHLAKHLRSKMHIMRLECLARVPFGLYAELERANSLLTEINTTDCDMCLESLKILARKLFSNDPNKLVQIEQPTNSLSLSNSSYSNQDQQVSISSP